MKTGIELIAAERKRQIKKKGWSAKHDDSHDEGELSLFAAHYAILASLQARPNLDPTCSHALILQLATKATLPLDWYSSPRCQLSNLIRAGALIAAEIDRIQRKSSTDNENQ